MDSADLYTAQFDEVRTGGRTRVTVGSELRDRESDGSIPTEAWFHGEEFRLDVEMDNDVVVYVRRL